MTSKGKLLIFIGYLICVKQLSCGRWLQVNLFIQHLLSICCLPGTIYCVFEIQRWVNLGPCYQGSPRLLRSVMGNYIFNRIREWSQHPVQRHQVVEGIWHVPWIVSMENKVLSGLAKDRCRRHILNDLEFMLRLL